VVAAVAVIWFGEAFRMELVLGGVIAALAIEVYYHGGTLIDVAGGLLRTCTRPTLQLLLPSRVSV